jgi:nicotinamide riboside transporter PnuC
MTGIEAVAVFFGLLCVWFCIRQYLMLIIRTGLTQVALFIYLA